MTHTKSELIMTSLLVFSTIFLVLFVIFFVISHPDDAIVSPAIVIQVSIFFCIIVLHGKNTLGGKNLILFILIAFSIPLLMESLGTMGVFYPWCYWQYTDKLGPMFLGKVPYIIPLTWLTFLYCTWTMANIICRRIGTERIQLGKLTSLRQFLIHLGVGVIAGLIMTAWDLINDPVMVARGYWYWPEGGAYYGIPVGNYFFWILTASLVFGVYNLYLGFIGQNQVYYHKEGIANSRTTLMAILPYFLVFLIQAILAIPLGVGYAIPWAAITVGTAMLLTVWRFFQQNNHPKKKSN